LREPALILPFSELLLFFVSPAGSIETGVPLCEPLLHFFAVLVGSIETGAPPREPPFILPFPQNTKKRLPFRTASRFSIVELFLTRREAQAR
jgi:hypothetical protein